MIQGADAPRQVVPRRSPGRDQVPVFFGQLPPCVVAMDACGDAQVRPREVRPMPPACVKTFVKRQTKDAADAEAICEVSSRLRNNQKIPGIV